MGQSILNKALNKHDDGDGEETRMDELGGIIDKYRDDVRTLTQVLEAISPKVVLVPVGLPLLRELAGEKQAVVQCPEDSKLLQAIRSGAVSYLAKGKSGDGAADVMKDIKDCAYPLNGSLPDRSKVAEQSLRRLHEIAEEDVEVGAFNAPLTPRETQTLKYVAEGYSNKQIAHALYVSEQTIKNHVSAVQHKLGANNRTHAVVLALRSGCIHIGNPAPEI
jgi:two-component system, NarL family, response regulator DegU